MWSLVLRENPTITQLKNSLPCLEPERFFSYLEVSATLPYVALVKSMRRASF